MVDLECWLLITNTAFPLLIVLNAAALRVMGRMHEAPIVALTVQ